MANYGRDLHPFQLGQFLVNAANGDPNPWIEWAKSKGITPSHLEEKMGAGGLQPYPGQNANNPMVSHAPGGGQPAGGPGMAPGADTLKLPLIAPPHGNAPTYGEYTQDKNAYLNGPSASQDQKWTPPSLTTAAQAAPTTPPALVPAPEVQMPQGYSIGQDQSALGSLPMGVSPTGWGDVGAATATAAARPPIPVPPPAPDYSNALSALTGVEAPPNPEFQHISSPGLPSRGPIGGNQLVALITSALAKASGRSPNLNSTLGR